MKNKTSRIFRGSILSIVAAAFVAAPLFAVAAVSNVDSNSSILKAKKYVSNYPTPDITYARLQDQSRDICGSSNVRMTGDIKRSVENTKCYEGTLDSAVSRLDDPAVTALHQES